MIDEGDQNFNAEAKHNQLIDALGDIRESLDKIAEYMALSLDGERGFRVNVNQIERQGPNYSDMGF